MERDTCKSSTQNQISGMYRVNKSWQRRFATTCCGLTEGLHHGQSSFVLSKSTKERSACSYLWRLDRRFRGCRFGESFRRCFSETRSGFSCRFPFHMISPWSGTEGGRPACPRPGQGCSKRVARGASNFLVLSRPGGQLAGTRLRGTRNASRKDVLEIVILQVDKQPHF